MDLSALTLFFPLPPLFAWLLRMESDFSRTRWNISGSSCTFFIFFIFNFFIFYFCAIFQLLLQCVCGADRSLAVTALPWSVPSSPPFAPPVPTLVFSSTSSLPYKRRHGHPVWSSRGSYQRSLARSTDKPILADGKGLSCFNYRLQQPSLLKTLPNE